MERATLHIKNMVCSRCQKVVRRELESLGLHPLAVGLGQVTLQESAAKLDKEALGAALAKHGFELLDDKKAWVIEKIKSTIIEAIHHCKTPQANFSGLIAQEAGLDYAYLSSLFSSTKGITIEKYIILQRIERVKELLVYDELSLSQIADQLGYSSVQHLSNQFKKVTDLTPSYYKKLQENRRRPLDEV
jgi:AraC family transcriptional regulator